MLVIFYFAKIGKTRFKFIAREICNISLLEIIGGKYGALRFCTPSQYVNTNPSTRPQRSNK